MTQMTQNLKIPSICGALRLGHSFLKHDLTVTQMTQSPTVLKVIKILLVDVKESFTLMGKQCTIA